MSNDTLPTWIGADYHVAVNALFKAYLSRMACNSMSEPTRPTPASQQQKPTQTKGDDLQQGR